MGFKEAISENGKLSIFGNISCAIDHRTLSMFKWCNGQ
jgi:hypothetical protein